MTKTAKKIKRKKITAWSLHVLLLASLAFMVIMSMWVLNTGTIIETTRDGFLRNRAIFALVMAVISFITSAIGTILARNHNHLNMEIYFAFFSLVALLVSFVFPLQDMQEFRNNMAVRHGYFDFFPTKDEFNKLPLEERNAINAEFLELRTNPYGDMAMDIKGLWGIDVWKQKVTTDFAIFLSTNNFVGLGDEMWPGWIKNVLEKEGFLSALYDMVHNPIVILQEDMFIVNIAIFSTTVGAVLYSLSYVLIKYGNVEEMPPRKKRTWRKKKVDVITEAIEPKPKMIKK